MKVAVFCLASHESIPFLIQVLLRYRRIGFFGVPIGFDGFGVRYVDGLVGIDSLPKLNSKIVGEWYSCRGSLGWTHGNYHTGERHWFVAFIFESTTNCNGVAHGYFGMGFPVFRTLLEKS